jgi:hypothetical protein
MGSIRLRLFAAERHEAKLEKIVAGVAHVVDVVLETAGGCGYSQLPGE